MNYFILFGLGVIYAMSYVGIVAGMWPCGTISFVDELFRSESKAQVYGSLHTYFYTNPVSTKDISKIRELIILLYQLDHIATCL